MPFNHHRVKAIHPTTYRGGGLLAHDVLKICINIISFHYVIMKVTFELWGKI